MEFEQVENSFLNIVLRPFADLSNGLKGEVTTYGFQAIIVHVTQPLSTNRDQLVSEHTFIIILCFTRHLCTDVHCCATDRILVEILEFLCSGYCTEN